MNRMLWNVLTSFALVATAATAAVAQEWSAWGGDERSSRYSALDQVDASNFGKLEIAWRWSASNYGPTPDFIYRATPLYVNGKLYTVAGKRRTVVCIEPSTGETLWMFREKSPGDEDSPHVR